MTCTLAHGYVFKRGFNEDLRVHVFQNFDAFRICNLQLSLVATFFIRYLNSEKKVQILCKGTCEVELQWLEHLWDHGKFVLDMGSSNH